MASRLARTDKEYGMDELSKLGLKYGTDKIGKHHYLPVYYELFKDRRNEVKKVLEIGPAEGAGLFMFRDFFPNALIYGIEIDQKRVDKLQGLVGIQVFKGDQSNRDELLDVLDQILPGSNDLDLIIDDGSHKPEDQIFTCLTLMPFLKLGNTTYIIEDVADEIVYEKIKKTNDYNVEMRRVGDRYDDRLVIVRHKNG